MLDRRMQEVQISLYEAFETAVKKGKEGLASNVAQDVEAGAEALKAAAEAAQAILAIQTAYNRRAIL